MFVTKAVLQTGLHKELMKPILCITKKGPTGADYISRDVHQFARDAVHLVSCAAALCETRKCQMQDTCLVEVLVWVFFHFA